MPEFPEPDLVDHGDPSSRPALEALGRATWDAALDWLYGLARERPISPLPYAEARRAYFGPTNEPAPAPAEPTSSDAVLAEFRERIAQLPMSAQWWKRIFLGNAMDVEMDGTGRVLISPELRAAAGIEKETMLLGMGNHFELWDKATYEAQELRAMQGEMPDVFKEFSF